MMIRKKYSQTLHEKNLIISIYPNIEIVLGINTSTADVTIYNSTRNKYIYCRCDYLVDQLNTFFLLENN